MNEPKRVEFAPRQRVSANPELAKDFIRRVLRLDWAFISDESTLWDFHEAGTNETLLQRIREVYRVDVSDIESAKLPDILERIAKETSRFGVSLDSGQKA